MSNLEVKFYHKFVYLGKKMVCFSTQLLGMLWDLGMYLLWISGDHELGSLQGDIQDYINRPVCICGCLVDLACCQPVVFGWLTHCFSPQWLSCVPVATPSGVSCWRCTDTAWRVEITPSSTSSSSTVLPMVTASSFSSSAQVSERGVRKSQKL